MNVIQVDGFVATIVRSSKRKTAAIKIQKGCVFVMVPAFLKLAAIEAIVASKQRWIKEKLAQQNELVAVQPKQYSAGEIFGYLGKDHYLTIVTAKTASIRLSQDRLEVSLRAATAAPEKTIKQLLSQWYAQQAVVELNRRTGYYAGIIGVKPRTITVKTFRARWGSCTSSGNIYYNWKIIIAPGHIVDYVVIHELCHLLHHNHSPAFWQAVARYCPDYRECTAWLKANGGYLEV